MVYVILDWANDVISPLICIFYTFLNISATNADISKRKNGVFNLSWNSMQQKHCKGSKYDYSSTLKRWTAFKSTHIYFKAEFCSCCRHVQCVPRFNFLHLIELPKVKPCVRGFPSWCHSFVLFSFSTIPKVPDNQEKWGFLTMKNETSWWSRLVQVIVVGDRRFDPLGNSDFQC